MFSHQKVEGQNLEVKASTKVFSMDKVDGFQCWVKWSFFFFGALKINEIHHRLNGHEFEQTPGDSGGQRSLACCSPWGHKESDVT